MGKHNLGKVQVYTGDSKGKTTTAIGMAVRAHGQNLKVKIIQFLKGGAYTGELITLRNYLPQIEIFQYGKPCVKERKQLSLDQFAPGDEHRAFKDINYIREDIDCGSCRYCFLDDDEQVSYVREAWEKTLKIINENECDMLILDEINVSLQKGQIKLHDVLRMIREKPKNMELILTGRGAPLELMQEADLVTEFNVVKHYFDKGVSARRGIEY